MDLPKALSGTSLAAIVYDFHGLQHRLYYQAENLTVSEYCYNGTTWVPGQSTLSLLRSRIADALGLMPR